MNRLRRPAESRKRAPRVRVGPSDRSLTGMAGLAAVAELVDRLGVVEALDERVGPVKRRARGLSGGELLVGLATGQLAGQATLAGLDRLRLDEAGGLLAAVPFAPSRTAARLSGRFGPAALSGLEAMVGVLAGRWLSRLPGQRRTELVAGRPTIDLDSSDVEVYGRKKRGVAYTYEGKKAGRPLLASWARTGLVLAADLLAGDQDVRPRAASLLARALANLPTAVCAPPLVRADSGFFTGELARAAVRAGADFAIAAPRNSALWRAYAAVDENAWTDARDMAGAQLAAAGYAPAGWPPGTYTIIRRVKVPAVEISTDPRSRRRPRSRKTSSPSRSTASPTTPGRSASSSRTSPPTNPRASSPSSTGSAAAPTSRPRSKMSSSAPACATCPRPTRPSTRSGCGRRSWPAGCPRCSSR
ncbi:transposase family protein [Frankia torreyi]|uniref:Transposase family protein n=1 Tax=Frankia torreyi TaxID=1856 RepID=A0A0D8B5C0_9ACTN|nr:transposase family protein [Frankia torreyi]